MPIWCNYATKGGRSGRRAAAGRRRRSSPSQRGVAREPSRHLVILNEQHLRAVLAEFVRYYNTERPHRSLVLDTPRLAVRPAAGPIHSRPVLGGLHHVYERTG